MARPLNKRLLQQLQPQAHLPGGTPSTAIVVTQKGSHSYIMTTVDGTGLVSLVATNSPEEGQAFLVATDANGSTYWVTKLTANAAHLTQRSMTGSYQFATGSYPDWTLGAASEGAVSIAHI